MLQPGTYNDVRGNPFVTSQGLVRLHVYSNKTAVWRVVNTDIEWGAALFPGWDLTQFSLFEPDMQLPEGF